MKTAFFWGDYHTTPPSLKVLRRPVEFAQYASYRYQDLLDEHHIRCSMSRKGNCWDNAVMERFFLNLKMERVWQRCYASHAEAEKDILQYIVEFYNPIRLHSTLNYQAPIQYELQAVARRLTDVSEIT